MRKFHVITLLCVSAASLLATPVIFEKQMADGRYARLRIEQDSGPSPTVPSGLAETMKSYVLRVGDDLEAGEIVWQQRFPPIGTKSESLGGFTFFDAVRSPSSWMVCYKLGRSTIVETMHYPAQALRTNPPSVEIHVDHFGSGLVATRAAFEDASGVVALNLGFRDFKVRTWVHHEADGTWKRNQERDFNIPHWARPINLASPKLAGGPINTTFPTDDFSNLAWGEIANGMQVAIRFPKISIPAGTPIAAILHVRNTTNHVLNYRVSTVVGEASPIDFLISGASGKRVECASSRYAKFIAPTDVELKVGEQKVHAVRLDTQFDLPPGAYSVVVKLRVAESHEGVGFQVSSKPAPLLIE